MNRLVRIFITCLMLAVTGYIIWRLPVNGWGSIVWLAGMIAMTIIRIPHASANKENTITDQRQASFERLLLFLVMVGGTFLPIFQLTLGLFDFANYELPFWATLAGAVLLVGGLWLFWRSHADLGRNWSVTTELRENHTLITNGVYKRIRHPMYSAIWILFLAQPLLIHNWVAGFGAVVSFAIMYVCRVPYEEQMMRDQFGAEYYEYCKQTGRLWPK